MKIKINTHGNPMPVSHGEWIDLAAAEEVVMKSGEFKIIGLGVSMELPEGYYAQVAPRSSTCKNFGIIMANSLGIIENDYCGDNDVWGFPAYAIRDTVIHKGDRICQFCLKKQEVPVEFEQVDSLGNPDRGGFGSTGKAIEEDDAVSDCELAHCICTRCRKHVENSICCAGRLTLICPKNMTTEEVERICKETFLHTDCPDFEALG